MQGEVGAAGPEGLAGATGATGAEGPAGQAGAAGAAGPEGPAGAVGETGESGPQGLRGVQGEVGAAGPEGAPGADGAAGEVGAAGADGEPGADGEAGANGTDGETGPEGPEGANGPAEYGYIYNTVVESIALGGAVSFGSNGVLSPGIEHVAGSTDTVVTTAGIYEIDFSTSTVGPSQLTLFVDGVSISGSTYGSGAGTQQNGGQVLASLPAGAILTLRNDLSSAAVELQPNAGGTQASTNASILITLIDGTP